MHAPLPSTSRVSLASDGTVEGYASLFGELDQARDMVMPGAFAQTLQSRGLRKIPMLFQHDPSEPVGIWLELREDIRGLWARGRLIPEVARGRELMALVQQGAIDGLSIGYRQNGTFVMNRKTQAAIRKFKDSGGDYLWQPPTEAGGRASLMTFPLVEAEDMPDIAADSLSIAFGDFKRGYLIVDRLGVRVLRDPYSAKPYVLFYTTKRVGGGVQDFDAIKVVKFAAS